MRIASRGLRTGCFPSNTSDGNKLRPDKLRFHLRLAVFQQHLDDFLQIAPQFVQRFALRMRADKTRNMTDEQTGLRTFFNNCGESFHNAPFEYSMSLLTHKILRKQLNVAATIALTR